MRDAKQSNLFRKFFHEPVAPYFCSAYNTLMSIVQGIAFASLLYAITKYAIEGDIEGEYGLLFFFWKALIVLFIIGVIWHRYIVHDQYLAWPLSVTDTIIPMVFGVGQVALALLMSHDPFWFSGVYAALLGWGTFAYWNTTRKHEKTHAEEIYREHFKEYEEFGDELLKSVQTFENRQVQIFFYLTVASIACTVFIYQTTTGFIIDHLIICILCTGSFFYLYFRDLKYHFMNDPHSKKISAMYKQPGT